MDDRIEALFHQAVELTPDRRRALLDAECRGDDDLRREVERLLAEDSRLLALGDAGGFLDSPILRSEEAPGADSGRCGIERAGSPSDLGPASSELLHVPHYQIVRLIGEGGMGAVYEAVQDSPRRPVALKVIRLGFASPSLLRRFHHEAQILGRLSHPGIAQVYEAGFAGDGQPFFAMEFIRGLPLDAYADRQGLDHADRVALLARVCDAVQHAHDQGVVHRDLKPANILVDESGLPKVLDFGVARATDADPAASAGLTRTGQFLGTPNYMSPEQVRASSGEVDHRADVYALGMVLFELLARKLPHRLESRPLVEAAQAILHDDVPRLGSIVPELRGDVETIVAKALEKEPARRYPSAADLASDLRRWLNHEPIRARAPSALYHLHKFTRRNKALVGGVVATGLALVLGLIGTTMFAIGEARQRALAERHANAAIGEKREARFQSYRARLAAAIAAISAYDVADAARHLEAAPEELRDWEWRHLHSRLDDSSAIIPLPVDGSGFLVEGKDRLRVGRLDADGLRITNLEQGEGLHIPVHAREPRWVSASETPLGLRVAVSSGLGSFDLYGAAGDLLCRSDRIESLEPRAIASPDGTRVATPRGAGDGVQITVFDARSGKPTAVCGGHRENIWSFAFSPDGARLATGGEDRTAKVWDAAAGTLLGTYRGHQSKVLDVSFSADGTRLLTASADGTVRQWDVATCREVEPPYERHAGVVAAAFSPDGRHVASAGSDRTIRLWRASGRQDVAVLLGHRGNVGEVAFAPDGRRLASVSRSSMLNITGDDTFRIWDVDPPSMLPVLRGHTGEVYPTAFSPDGRWIASGSWDKSVRIWDAATGEPCAVLPHPDVVHDLAYGPDGSWLVTASLADSRLRIWDAATARLRREIELPPGRLRFVSVRPDGRRIAATATAPEGEVANVYVCDVESGRLLHSMPALGLAYSPDGRWLAVRDALQTDIVLIDAETHERVSRLAGHEKPVASASFSPDGRLLASCGRDRTVRIWRLDDGGCQVLRGHTDDVFAAAFHPDGKRLASAGRDRAVWIWDLSRGEEVARLQGHAGYVWSLAFSPDGATLASGSGDATIRLWDTKPLAARSRARREAEAIHQAAERLVEPLWQERSPDEVVAALRSDRAMGDRLREAALRVVLRKTLAP